VSELASYPDYPFSPKRFDRGNGIGLSYLDEGPAEADPAAEAPLPPPPPPAEQ